MADQNSKIQLEGRATTMNAVLISIRPKWCEKIISGEVVVPDDKESFEAKYGDVYQLD